MTRGRPLSALRPLPRGAWLPLAGLGVLSGQGLGEGATATTLLVAAALAVPAALLRHRRLGTATALLVVPALLGQLHVRWDAARRDERVARVEPRERAFHGRVADVRLGSGRAGTTRATLDVAVGADAGSFHPGERMRLTVWNTTRTWRVGDRVAFRVTPQPPRGFCNRGRDGYLRSLWRSGVVATASVPDDAAVVVTPRPRDALEVGAAVAAARTAIDAALARAVADDAEREVLRALIIGDQSAIPDDLRRAYARTGAAHVLSVSGLHIALVATTVYAGAAWGLARWPWLALRVLVARPAALAALPPALAYTLLAGGAIATLRSLVMAAIALGAVVLLRRPDVWTALATAALVLCLADPGVGDDASFQLSFASVAALVLAGRWSQVRRAGKRAGVDPRRSPARRARELAAAALIASAAASVATAPITAFHFGSVPLVGVAANLVVVPLVGWLPVILGLSGSALLAVSASGGELLLWSAARVVAPANRFVVWLASHAWSALDVSIASGLTVLALGALLAAWHGARGGARALLAGAATVALLAAAVEEMGPSLGRRLMVRFLDVGQGDASLLVTPGGLAVLVDGGGLGGSFDPGERVVLPALRRAAVRHLDAVALSHPDHDHYGGLAAVVRSLPVREFWSSGRTSSSASFLDLVRVLEESRVAMRRLVRGDRLRPVAAGAEVSVLHPPRTNAALSENDASLVLRVTFGATRVLLTGDVESDAERALCTDTGGVAATVVKVPHHGSRTSSTRGLLAASRPGAAVAMVGWRNRFGFPAAEVRERYGSLGAAWRETARDGEVVLLSDGQLEEVRTCR